MGLSGVGVVPRGLCLMLKIGTFKVRSTKEACAKSTPLYSRNNKPFQSTVQQFSNPRVSSKDTCLVLMFFWSDSLYTFLPFCDGLSFDVGSQHFNIGLLTCDIIPISEPSENEKLALKRLEGDDGHSTMDPVVETVFACRGKHEVTSGFIGPLTTTIWKLG